jgi:hypothetical protein
VSDLRAEFEVLYERNGKLTPELVVDAARPQRSALHDYFEWDDAIAGEAFRREQARHLIKSVRVSYTTPSGEVHDVRAFHALRDEDEPGKHYEFFSAEDVASDPLRRGLLLRDMERDWFALRRRWESFSEFWSLIATEVEQTGRRVRRRRRKAS